MDITDVRRQLRADREAGLDFSDAWARILERAAAHDRKHHNFSEARIALTLLGTEHAWRDAYIGAPAPPEVQACAALLVEEFDNDALAQAEYNRWADAVPERPSRPPKPRTARPKPKLGVHPNWRAVKADERFGLLVVTEDRVLGDQFIATRCDCGAERRVPLNSLLHGRARSCGSGTCKRAVQALQAA